MLRWRQFQLWHNCLSNFIATSESLRAETIAGCCQQVLCLGHELKVKAADFLLPLSRSWWWSNINISSAKSHRAGWTWLPFTPEAVRWVCRAAPFLQGSAWLSLLREVSETHLQEHNPRSMAWQQRPLPLGCSLQVCLLSMHMNLDMFSKYRHICTMYVWIQ